MNRLKIYFLIVALTLTFFSCRKDTPPTLQQQGNISVSTTKRLLICNEGGYIHNNGSISIYDPTSNDIIISAFAASNPTYTLGDVVQSINKFKSNYYVVVNNSGKVVVCNNILVKTAVIPGFISPRYIEFVSNDKAYVSNFKLPANSNQTNYIHVVDLNLNTITKTIRLDGWSEEMVLSYGNVFVTNQNKKYVYVINSGSDIIIDSIYVGATNAHIVKDANEKLWVGCDADSTTNTAAKLVKINPVNNTIEATISLNTSHNSISRLSINGNGTTLYFLMNDVFKMDITATSATNIIQQGTHTFYGLCIDPNDETIYISDALDYNSNGKIYRYQANLNYMGTYGVGLIPGFMLMD